MWWRQTASVLIGAALFALVGCGGGPDTGEVGYVEGFLGGVMADEPRAALVGRDTLSAGGSAADAAVAAYFTMAVTYPGGAGLGGGGVCLVYDPERERADAFEFLPRAPAAGGATYAVPGNVRGMFAVHARYGQLNWSGLLRPAEALARDGHTVSRAFARALNANAATLRRDPETARAFGIADGEVREGTPLRQIALSTMLSSLRLRGAGDFYQGVGARLFVDAVRRSGGKLNTEDMRAYLPRLQTPLSAKYGNDLLYFSGGGGIVAGRVWAMLRDGDRYVDAADEGARAHLIAEASMRAYLAGRNPGETVSIAPEAGAALIAGFDPRRHGVPSVGGGDGFAAAANNGATLVTVDRFGQTVACGFTMGRPFGAGVIAPGTGVLLASAEPVPLVSQPAALIVTNAPNALSFLGAASSGGSPASLAALPFDTRSRGLTIDRAIALPRLYNAGIPDRIVHEDTWQPAAIAHLRELGYDVQERRSLGRINGFYCPEGLPREPACQFVNDARGAGLSASADK